MLCKIPKNADLQIKARPTRCHKWWFIGNQLFLNMFRASLRPSSGNHRQWHAVCCPYDGCKDTRNML